MDVPKVKLFKIFYDRDSQALIGPGYIPLDNCDGPADWFELWPILHYLETNTLEDRTWYGFFSPKFPEKALLTREEIDRVLSANPDSDVALFTYNWTALALYENTWLRGEMFHPGLIACTERFLALQGQEIDLRRVVSDFDTSVYSNYFVAKRSFWEEWQRMARAYVDYVEAGGPDLPDNARTSHMGDGGYRLRTFVQEQLVCWLLLSGSWRVARPDYAKDVSLENLMPDGDSRLLRRLLASADGCKRLARRTGWRGALLWLKLVRRVVPKLARRSGVSVAPETTA